MHLHDTGIPNLCPSNQLNCRCKLDTVSRQLTTPLTTYDLSYKEAALLELLLQHKNEVLERHEALIKIWGNDSIYNVNSIMYS
ncbi:winged helix-turn-helix domain-containing protein [Chitinophaga pendula]|uniref:winged helix-turn-helix domain-containing protein n=1 Tax=Chitinophaga TaxID=79328 RepID=UPI000BB04AB5|nr:hypothetical protein CK934_11550 [Chitinophaga sp. MD30]UCJ05444.1 winged helix-turn-helix domain-containing protein [Chitinophaga pendula]